MALDSKAYGIGGHDLFVALNESECGNLVIGRILLFFENGEDKLFYLQLFYKYKLFFLTDEECLAFEYQVNPTDRKKVFPLHSIGQKLIRFEFNSTFYLLTENNHFEHDKVLVNFEINREVLLICSYTFAIFVEFTFSGNFCVYSD